MMANSYPEPQDEIVKQVLTLVQDDALIEAFQERAGVIEFDAEPKSRGHAEALAALDMLMTAPQILTGVYLVETDLKGVTDWLLCTDIELAKTYLQNAGATRIETVDLREVLNGQYDGVCLLTVPA